MAQTCSVATSAVTLFICANCAHPSQVPDPSGRSRPTVPDFAWPFSAQEVLVPCTGRLQPEHVLKAFERGADLVVTVSCEKDQCEYLQGSERWSRRADYVRTLLDEIGLGGERLLSFSLPAATGAEGPPTTTIREEVLRTLDTVTPNPLCAESTGEIAEEQLYQQADTDYEANED